MAKIYSPQGIIRGTFGNLTYLYYNGMNVVRGKIITTKDALTSKQLFSRARYCNTLKMYQTIKTNLSRCFEKAKETDNSRNRFFSFNTANARPYTKDMFKDAYLAPIGDFYCSHGTLGILDYGSAYADQFLGVRINTLGSSNPKISEFSNALISTYNWIRNGDKFRIFGVLYDNLFPNTGNDKFTNPFIKGDKQRLRFASAEITVNTDNNAEYINDYGLIYTNSANVCIYDKFSEDFIHPIHFITNPLGISYFGAVIVRKNGELFYCSTNKIKGNSLFEQVDQTMSDQQYYDFVLESWRRFYKNKGKRIGKS